MFERRHYNVIAAVISTSRKIDHTVDQVVAIDDLITKLGVTFKLDNPRFNLTRFIEACEPFFKPDQPEDKLPNLGGLNDEGPGLADEVLADVFPAINYDEIPGETDAEYTARTGDQ